MVNCENFVEYVVDADEDMDESDREARDFHASLCEDCGRFLEGVRAYAAYETAVKNGAPRVKDAPWVRESVLRAASEAIDRRATAQPERVAPKKRLRRPVLALASAGALAFLGSLALQPAAVDVFAGRTDLPAGSDQFLGISHRPKPGSPGLGSTAPIDSGGAPSRR